MRPKSIRCSQIKGKVDVAIITIRQDEYDAMEYQLETSTPVEGGNNNYELATIHPDHQGPICVVLTRCVAQGNLPAQAVANNIIYDVDPAWLFLVGIAGGVPDNEFSLGDVVLASGLHDFSFGAVSKDGARTYQTVGGAMHPDVIRFLQTKIGGKNRARLTELAGFATLERFQKHPPLFPADLSESSVYYGPDEFRKDVAEKLAKRFANGTRKGPPVIWSGPCANGNILVKNTDLLTQWQQSARQIVDMETELAGVYEAARSAGRQNYPLLAIRGLSDIVGLKRDPSWTQYACDTAAAVAFAILRAGFITFSKNLPNNTDSPPAQHPAQIGELVGGVTPTSDEAQGPDALPSPRNAPETRENEDSDRKPARIHSNERIEALRSSIQSLLVSLLKADTKTFVDGDFDFVFARFELRALFPGVNDHFTIVLLPKQPLFYDAKRTHDLERFLLDQGRVSTNHLVLALSCEPDTTATKICDKWVCASIYELDQFAATKSPQRLQRLLITLFPIREFNPYQYTRIAPPDMFFGRMNEVGDICNSDYSFAVVGPRRVGKSSLAAYVTHELRRQAASRYSIGKATDRYYYSVCYLDMHTLPSLQDIWQELLRAMGLEAGDLMPGSRFRASLHDRKHLVVRSDFELLRNIMFNKYRRSLILLDEVDQAIREDRQSGYRVFGMLQGLIDNREASTRVVLFGYEGLIRAWESNDFPLNRQRLPRVIHLRPLNAEEVGRLIEMPMSRIGVKVNNLQAVQYALHGATAGMPNLVQQVCHRILELEDVNKNRQVSIEHVHTVLESGEILDGIDHLLDQIVEALPRLIVFLMAGYKEFSQASVLENLLRRRLLVDDKDVKHALDQLGLYGIVTPAGYRNEYRFGSDLLLRRVQDRLRVDHHSVIITALEHKVASQFGGNP